MKLLHLADLHLGKRVHEFSMVEDQAWIMDQILELAIVHQVDGILLAGDLYDKPIPPIEAVQLFDHFLTGLAQAKIPVFAVFGNHDSAERVAFGSLLMQESGIFLSRMYDGTDQKFYLQDAYGEAVIHLLPFLKPSLVRHVQAQQLDDFPENPRESYKIEADGISRMEGGSPSLEKTPAVGEIISTSDAVAYAISRMQVDPTKRNILVAHQFVTGAASCESEEVSVGGLDQIDGSLFDAFDYVALGHLHSPQQVLRETMRYSGTPLKYSFSEADQEKSVTLVELKEKGEAEVTLLPLSPLRDMRKLKGTYQELMEKSFWEQQNTQDYLQITLTDEEDIPFGLQKLRAVYPNLMLLEYDNARTRKNHIVKSSERIREKSELELFAEFYENQNNQSMTPEQKIILEKIVCQLRASAVENTHQQKVLGPERKRDETT